MLGELASAEADLACVRTRYLVGFLCRLAVIPPSVSLRLAWRVGNCATQRNLDARGREQAREIGAAIRAAGVIVDRVLTSQWCRCRDTARLLDLGPVEDLPVLNSFFRNPARSDRQTADLRQFLFGLLPGETVILVTHYVNIRALTGRSVTSGEVLLLQIGRDRTISVVDEILIGPER